MFDLGPAAEQMTRILGGLHDGQLAQPTPCPEYSIGDLVDHVAGLSVAFTAAATKQAIPEADRTPSADASRLDPAWREVIPSWLTTLAGAWRAEDAWQGTTMAGPVEMAAGEAALVTLDELIVHGWDLARASDQTFDVDPHLLEACFSFVSAVAASGEPTPGLFGAPIRLPDDAPRLDQLIGLTGRDPGWTPLTA
jgi:uncharacterized protein (TIGR03086 family)